MKRFFYGGSDKSSWVGKTFQVGRYSCTVEEIIAEGGFALVFLVKIPSGQRYALKRVSVNEKSDLDICKQEIQILRFFGSWNLWSQCVKYLLLTGWYQNCNLPRLQHILAYGMFIHKYAKTSLSCHWWNDSEPQQKLSGHKNTITFLDSAINVLQAGIYEVLMLMEYCRAGHVVQLMNEYINQGFSEKLVLKIFSDVTEAVALLHYSQPPICHRDLKVENVLRKDTGDFVLCDYGSATLHEMDPKVDGFRQVEDELQKYTTVSYRAPEMIDLYGGKKIGTKADIWALGCMLYKLCFFNVPFGESTLAIQSAQYTIPEDNRYSDKTVSLIKLLLEPDPDKRPDIFQVAFVAFSMLGKPCPVKNALGSAVPQSRGVQAPQEVEKPQAKTKMAPQISAPVATSVAPRERPLPVSTSLTPRQRPKGVTSFQTSDESSTITPFKKGSEQSARNPTSKLPAEEESKRNQAIRQQQYALLQQKVQSQNQQLPSNVQTPNQGLVQTQMQQENTIQQQQQQQQLNRHQMKHHQEHQQHQQQLQHYCQQQQYPVNQQPHAMQYQIYQEQERMRQHQMYQHQQLQQQQQQLQQQQYQQQQLQHQMQYYPMQDPQQRQDYYNQMLQQQQQQQRNLYLEQQLQQQKHVAKQQLYQRQSSNQYIESSGYSHYERGSSQPDGSQPPFLQLPKVTTTPSSVMRSDDEIKGLTSPFSKDFGSAKSVPNPFDKRQEAERPNPFEGGGTTEGNTSSWKTHSRSRSDTFTGLARRGNKSGLDAGNPPCTVSTVTVSSLVISDANLKSKNPFSPFNFSSVNRKTREDEEEEGFSALSAARSMESLSSPSETARESLSDADPEKKAVSAEGGVTSEAAEKVVPKSPVSTKKGTSAARDNEEGGTSSPSESEGRSSSRHEEDLVQEEKPDQAIVETGILLEIEDDENYKILQKQFSQPEGIEDFSGLEIRKKGRGSTSSTDSNASDAVPVKRKGDNDSDASPLISPSTSVGVRLPPGDKQYVYERTSSCSSEEHDSSVSSEDNEEDMGTQETEDKYHSMEGAHDIDPECSVSSSQDANGGTSVSYISPDVFGAAPFTSAPLSGSTFSKPRKDEDPFSFAPFHLTMKNKGKEANITNNDAATPFDDDFTSNVPSEGKRSSLSKKSNNGKSEVEDDPFGSAPFEPNVHMRKFTPSAFPPPQRYPKGDSGSALRNNPTRPSLAKVFQVTGKPR